MSGTPPRRLLPRALLALLGVALALGTSESLLRRHAAAVRRRIEEQRGWSPDRLCAQADDRLLYRLVPGRCGTNSRGFQDAEHALDKPPGVFRIVVIGDSVAAGVGDLRAIGHAFGQRLGELAAADCAGRPIEVIVLAVSGYSSGQELALLGEEGLRYHPDLILWSYCLNDPANPTHHDFNGELGLYYDRPNSYLLQLVEHAAFRARETLRIHLRQCPDEPHRRLHCAYAEEVERLFASLARVQADSGVPIAVLLQPLIERDGSPETYAFADLHAQLASTAAAHGLVSIDVLSAYLGHAWKEIGNGVTKTGWFDCYHPNAFGHDLAARTLFAELARRGLLPCGAAAADRGA